MQPALLLIESSGRSTRSITRRLAQRFADAWRLHRPEARIVRRDVGRNPPSPVDEAWIAAACAEEPARTAVMRAALRGSGELIDELAAAECVVIGAPIYNFGMPAQLKAYFDQVVRVGRTFAFEPGTATPYRPLLEPKPVVVIGFIGFGDVTFVRVGYDEFQDERLHHSLATAEAAIDSLVPQHAIAAAAARPPGSAGGVVG